MQFAHVRRSGQRQRNKAQEMLCRVVASQQGMQKNSQALYVGLRRRPYSSGAAYPDEPDGMVSLAWPGLNKRAIPESIRKTFPPGGAHNIPRLEIAKHDRWLASVQIFKHSAQLQPDLQRFCEREANPPGQIALQSLSFDTIYDQIAVFSICEGLIYHWQAGVAQ
jgi:hypothetical protein